MDDVIESAAPKAWVVLLCSAGAGLVVAGLYVLVFVVAPQVGATSAPVSWIFGAVFTVPVGLALCLLSAVGAIVGDVPAPRSGVGVLVGSLVGGALGVALAAGIGFPPAGIAYFATSAVVQSVILAATYRSARSRASRTSAS